MSSEHMRRGLSLSGEPNFLDAEDVTTEAFNGSVLESAARASGRSGSVVAGDNEELLVAAQDSANGDVAQPSACFASSKTPRPFDATAVDVIFDWRMFAKEFCYNFFWPFAGPVVRLVEGEAYYANHRFHTIGNFATILTVWAVNIMCIVRPSLFGAPNGLTVIEIFMMNLLCAVHKIMVAVKYAYMPTALVRELHQREFSLVELDSLQLITGWQRLTSENCDAELAQTAASLGFKLSETRFHVNHTIEELRDFIGRNDYPDMPSPSFVGLRQICLHAMLGKLTHHVYEASQPAAWSMLIIVLYSLVQAIFPVLIRSFQKSGRLDFSSFDMGIGWGFGQPGVSEFDSKFASSIIIISCFVRFAYSAIILIFVNVGILDLKRRARMLVALQRLVDPTPMPLHRLDCSMHAAIPENMLFLDLSVSQNIPNWWVARKVVTQFGLRFRRRIEAYMLVFSLMLVTVLLVMLAELLQAQQNATESINTMCLVLINFPAFVICLILMVMHGADGNWTYWTSRAILTRIQMAMRERLATIDASRIRRGRLDALEFMEDKTKIVDCNALIDSVIWQLEVEDATNPVSIVGFRASYGLLNSFATVSSALIAVGIKLVQSFSSV